MKGTSLGEVFITRNEASGIDLYQFASVEDAAGLSVVITSGILLVLWTVLLITVSGLKSNTWYIIAVGAIGMLQNTIVAGAPRSPTALGTHVKFETCIAETKVMTTLQAVEETHPSVRLTLLPVLFLSALRPDERAYWPEKVEALERRH